jgi:hypothetical protein
MEGEGHEEPDLGLQATKRKRERKKRCKNIYFGLETC